MDLNSSEFCLHDFWGISLNYFVFIATKKSKLNNLPRNKKKIFDRLLSD